MGYTAGSIALISLVKQPPTKQQFRHQSAALQVARTPHIPGVCDEGERGSISRIEIDHRKGRASQFLLQLDLPMLDVADLFFIDRDERRLGRGQQPVQELRFLTLNAR
ncbi:hypothetical protein [Hyphomicrobium sp.]|uniref:hypothetical protein n=1 Tax=Hyphomicrobium sp. TaxID=82 RepID=UPI003F71D25A